MCSRAPTVPYAMVAVYGGCGLQGAGADVARSICLQACADDVQGLHCDAHDCANKQACTATESSAWPGECAHQQQEALTCCGPSKGSAASLSWLVFRHSA